MDSKLSLFVLLAVAVQQGVALKCHNCDSITMPNCGDPFMPIEDEWQMDCGYSTSNKALPEILHDFFPGLKKSDDKNVGFEGVCFKTKYEKDNRTLIFRSCSMFGDTTCDLFTDSLQGDKGVMNFCEICKDELCNSAPGVNIVLSLILTAPLMLLLKFF